MPEFTRFMHVGIWEIFLRNTRLYKEKCIVSPLSDDHDMYKDWGDHPEYFFRAVENKMTDIRPTRSEVDLYCSSQSTFEDAVWGQNGAGSWRHEPPFPYIKIIIQDLMELGQKLHDEDKQELLTWATIKKILRFYIKKIDWVLKWEETFLLDEPDLKIILEDIVSQTPNLGDITGIDILSWVFYDPSETHMTLDWQLDWWTGTVYSSVLRDMGPMEYPEMEITPEEINEQQRSIEQTEEEKRKRQLITNIMEELDTLTGKIPEGPYMKIANDLKSLYDNI